MGSPSPSPSPLADAESSTPSSSPSSTSPSSPSPSSSSSVPSPSSSSLNQFAEDGYIYFSLIAVHPVTGRTHQIRAHMAHIGHPLISDFKYGPQSVGVRNWQIEQCARLFLHAARISIMTPTTATASTTTSTSTMTAANNADL